MYLSADEKQQITDKIRQVEQQTRGELVTVITHQSDDYYYIPTLWAALLAMVCPLMSLFFWITLSLGQIIFLQLATFALLTLIFRWQPVKLWLVPTFLQHTRAHRRAQELFFMEGLHLTQERTAVMLYVSMAEKYVEILADAGIDAQVGAEQWDGMIENFIRRVKAGEVAKGYLETIESCGELLIRYFPADDDTPNPNELPDHLLEID